MHIEIMCRKCKKYTPVEITDEQFIKLKEGKELVQRVLHDKPAEIRELFISNICGDCWDDLFKEEEE